MSEEPVRTYEKRVPIIIRGEFEAICEQDCCEAALLNHILYWIARNQKDGAEYYYATGEELQSCARAWSINIVRRAVKSLVARGFIGETQNPTHRYDRTKHFYFEEPQARALLTALTAQGICLFCISLPKDVLDMVGSHFTNLLNDTTRSGTLMSQICENHVVDFVTPITKITTKIPNKESATIASSQKGVIPFPEKSETRLTDKQLRTLDAQFERELWAIYERVLKRTVNEAARRKPGNADGLRILRDYSLEDIERALERASDYTRTSMNLTLLAQDIDGLLSAPARLNGASPKQARVEERFKL